MSDSMNTTLPVKVTVQYVSAQDRLLQQIANHIEHLTRDEKSFRLLIEYTNGRFYVWIGERAGVI